MPANRLRLRLRPRGRGRLVGARVDPQGGVVAGAQGAQPRQLDLQRVGRLAGRLLDGLHARLERRDALVDLLVELLRCGPRPPNRRTVLARFWAETALEPFAVTATRLLCAIGSAFTSFSSERGLRSVRSCSFAARPTSIVVIRPAAVVTSLVGSLEAVISPRVGEGRVVPRHGRDEQRRARLVGLLGGAHVQGGRQRRDEHRQGDQLEPLANGLDVAAQALLLARRDQPLRSLCLAGFDQIRFEVLEGNLRIAGRSRASCGSPVGVVWRRRVCAVQAVTMLLSAAAPHGISFLAARP